jgi:hypothetical protein
LSTGAIISGSQAVHFFDRTEPDSNSDLDVYVEHRYAYQLVAFFLAPHQGYELVLEEECGLESAVSTIKEGGLAFPSQKQYEGEYIAQVYTFVHDDGRKVQLVTTLDAVMAVILQFHSSALLDSLGAQS